VDVLPFKVTATTVFRNVWSPLPRDTASHPVRPLSWITQVQKEKIGKHSMIKDIKEERKKEFYTFAM
jgi:hypothetical protein